MREPRRRSSRVPVTIWLWACLAAGCGVEARGPAALPPPDLASSRAALVAALDAWKAGKRDPGGLIGEKPAVGLVDSTRSERPLLDFEVVGALGVAERARPFAVRLVLDAPREDVATRYYVLGLDPLWVFRQDDYERILHWEHKMTDAEAADGR